MMMLGGNWNLEMCPTRLLKRKWCERMSMCAQSQPSDRIMQRQFLLLQLMCISFTAVRS